MKIDVIIKTKWSKIEVTCGQSSLIKWERFILFMYMQLSLQTIKSTI